MGHRARGQFPKEMLHLALLHYHPQLEMAVRSEMQYLRARDMNLIHLYAQITKSVSYSCRDDTAPQHVPSSAHYQQPQQKGWFGHEQHCSAQIEAVEE